MHWGKGGIDLVAMANQWLLQLETQAMRVSVWNCLECQGPAPGYPKDSYNQAQLAKFVNEMMPYDILLYTEARV